MIIKNYEISKIDPNINKLILFYGKNEGHKNESLKKLINKKNKILVYEEQEILQNENIFLENVLSGSLFEEKKTIIIKRGTDKILSILEKIEFKNLEDITIFINAGNLEKKSKLRSFFEKSKNFFSIAFYPDNEQTLIKLAYDYLKKINISLSNENINVLISKCGSDRQTLKNELKKIENLNKSKKKITTEDISKLVNLAEDYSVSELVDYCLAKNEKKIIKILNENNFKDEDSILITRTFLNKSKKILKLSNEYKKNKNIEQTLSNARPPIFWKDKEITKQQIYKWEPNKIKNLIYELSEIELLGKKNLNNSINLITNFILEQSSSKN